MTSAEIEGFSEFLTYHQYMDEADSGATYNYYLLLILTIDQKLIFGYAVDLGIGFLLEIGKV